MCGVQCNKLHMGAVAPKLPGVALPHAILASLCEQSGSGYELARRFRAHPGFGRTVLVALSGYGRDTDKQQAAVAGFDHHYT